MARTTIRGFHPALVMLGALLVLGDGASAGEMAPAPPPRNKLDEAIEVPESSKHKFGKPVVEFPYDFEPKAKTDLTILIQKASCNEQGFKLKLRAQNASSPTVPTDKDVLAEVFYRPLRSSQETLVPHPQNPESIESPMYGGSSWHLNGFDPGPGQYQIIARIDGPDAQAESNENNNQATAGLTCP